MAFVGRGSPRVIDFDTYFISDWPFLAPMLTLPAHSGDGAVGWRADLGQKGRDRVDRAKAAICSALESGLSQQKRSDARQHEIAALEGACVAEAREREEMAVWDEAAGGSRLLAGGIRLAAIKTARHPHSR